MADNKKSTSLQRVQHVVDSLKDLDQRGVPDFMADLTPHLNLVSVDDSESHHKHPRVVFSYTVQPQHCNRSGNLHGGATATLFDFTTTLAVVLAPTDKSKLADTNWEWRRLGVSRTLLVTYVRPIPRGTEVLIENELVHAGKRLISLRGVLRRSSDGAVLATCEHGKAIPESIPSKI